VAGPCEGYYPSWYFDPQREMCLQFVYGGCLGNNNRFATREMCENNCLLTDRIGWFFYFFYFLKRKFLKRMFPKISPTDACDQPKTEGPCKGNFSRFSFDKGEEKCVPFQYGGCKGNGNNFLTEQECHQRCSHEGRMRGNNDSTINLGCHDDNKC
jgi:hypothetical protein